jgi:N-acetylmuramoyl-L-alanine amidase
VSQYSFALTKEYYKDKYDTTKRLYLGAIMSNDRAKEVEYLRKLIRYADKLDLNTLKYQKELNRIDTSTVIKNKVETKSYLKPPVIKAEVSKPKIIKQEFSIQSVTQDINSITINFYDEIDKSFIDFVEKKENNYHYDEFNINGNFKDARPTKLFIKGVNKITIYQYKKDILRIQLRDTTNLKTIYIIRKKSITIKVLDLDEKSKKNSVQMLPNDMFFPSAKTIVIDAGHGGKDAGAVGSGRNYEKNIVLNVAKYLKKELTKMGFKVYLTRTRDKYVKLNYRTHFANIKNADIFISLHANAVPKSKAKSVHGVETYFLSPARSARAKRVAALENKGDMDKMGWGSKNSLLTILNQSKITASNKIAIDIQRNMLYKLRDVYGKSAIRDGGVREGPFWVLVGAQMPSVLIEVGYISHPKEGRRIKTIKYQKNIANAIALGVKSYFIKN